MAVAATLAAATAAGCLSCSTSTNGSQPGRHSTAADVPGTVCPVGELHLAVVRVHRFVVPEPGVQHLTLFGHWLAFAAARAGAQQIAERIEVIDTRTGRRSVVASNEFPNGQTDWVEGTGNTLVWTAQSRVQTDSDPTAEWVLHSRNLRTGTNRQLDSSHGQPSAYIPTPEASNGWVIWAVASRLPGTLDVKVSNGDRTKVIARGVRPSGLGIAGRSAVFDSGPAQGGPRHVYAVPLSGGSASQLDLDGNAAYPSAGGNVAVWQEPLDGDPQAIWAVNLASRCPARAVWLEPNEGNAVAGNGFVAWLQDGGIAAASLRNGPTVSVSKEAAVATRLAADGDLLAWGQPTVASQPDKSTTLHIARVSGG